MKNKRLIARLDVKNDALVKGIHLEGLRALGSPKSFAELYYQEGVDEILYMDVVASLYGRNGLLDLVKETAKNIFVPMTVGGGIRALDDVGRLLDSGADKVCINTAAVKNPELISEIAYKYGASTLVVAIEAINVDGKYQAFIDNGREYTGLDVVEWAKQVEALGAGEVLLTSVDREGTGKGFDYELITQVQKVVNLPMIIHGGAGCSQDIEEAYQEHDVDAVCVASLLHYNSIKHLSNQDDIQGNTAFLKSGMGKSAIQDVSVHELKDMLKQKNISIR